MSWAPQFGHLISETIWDMAWIFLLSRIELKKGRIKFSRIGNESWRDWER